MKKTNAEDAAYENFYMELSQTDYLNDIEIQDEYEEPHEQSQGLSDEQVSKIAQDSLNQPPEHSQSGTDSGSSDEPR